MVGHCTLVCIIKWVWVCRNKTTYLCNIPQIIVGPHLEEEEEEEEGGGGAGEEEEGGGGAGGKGGKEIQYFVCL